MSSISLRRGANPVHIIVMTDSPLPRQQTSRFEFPVHRYHQSHHSCGAGLCLRFTSTSLAMEGQDQPRRDSDNTPSGSRQLHPSPQTPGSTGACLPVAQPQPTALASLDWQVSRGTSLKVIPFLQAALQLRAAVALERLLISAVVPLASPSPLQAIPTRKHILRTAFISSLSK